MKKIMYYIIGLVVVLLLLFWGLAIMSKNGEAAGLVDGKLAPLPDSPNCVCSEEHTAGDFRVEPFEGQREMWDRMKAAVKDLGGEIKIEDEFYIHAEFSSSIFGFVDDFEARYDAEKKLIHFRSASRVGHSDMGVNKKRVEAIRAKLK